jgi:hypothetical protein
MEGNLLENLIENFVKIFFFFIHTPHYTLTLQVHENKTKQNPLVPDD